MVTCPNHGDRPKRRHYYRLLLAVTREDAWEPWLLYLLRGIEETAAWTTAKIGAIRSLASATVEYVRGGKTDGL